MVAKYEQLSSKVTIEFTLFEVINKGENNFIIELINTLRGLFDERICHSHVDFDDDERS